MDASVHPLLLGSITSAVLSVPAPAAQHWELQGLSAGASRWLEGQDSFG